MNLLGKLQNIFDTEKTVQVDDFQELSDEFSERKEDRLEKIDKKSSEYREKCLEVLEELEEDLNNLEDFEDRKGRAVIEDNIANFVSARKNLIDKFSTPDDIEDFHEELEQFLTGFNEMSQKDGAVLEEAGIEDSFSESLKELTELEEEIRSFLKTEYRTKERFDEIKDKIQDLREVRDNIDSVMEDIEELEISEVESNLEDRKEELEDLENSEMKEDYDRIQERIDEEEDKIDEVYGKFSRAIGRSERGLKKLLYEGEIGKVSEQGSDILRDIRDGEKTELINRHSEEVEDAVKAAEKAAKESSEINDKTQKKLLNGLGTLENFSELKEDLQGSKQEKGELEEQLENHDFSDGKEKLEKEKKSLERKVSQLQGKKDELFEEKNSLEDKENKLENEIVDLFESEIGKEVELNK